MGFPHFGQVPDVMPTLAATGVPQLGQVPIWTWDSPPATALGLKHMINLRSFRQAHTPGNLRRPSVGVSPRRPRRAPRFHIATR